MKGPILSQTHETEAYIVGSGWFVAQGEEPETRILYGDDVTRTGYMHSLWLKSVSSALEPCSIHVVNSDSQVESPLAEDKRVHWADLEKNYGHSTSHLGKYSGWMRTHFALCGILLASDAKWLIFVEQDVLLHGQGFIEREIGKSKGGIFLVGARASLSQFNNQFMG